MIQFEIINNVGKITLNRPGKYHSFIKDMAIHQRICSEISEWFETIYDSKVLSIIESPIKGPKGNVEFLITVKFQK